MKENYRSLWVAGLFFVALFVVMSFRYITGAHVLMTTDAIISGGGRLGMEAIRLFIPNWRDQSLLGFPAGGATQVPTLLKVFVPGVLWNNLSYFLACLLISFALIRYLSPLIKSLAGRMIAALVSVWVGSNFTLLYSGHGFKPYVVLFFVLSLLSISKMVSGRISASLIYGSCVGLMFVQQPDIALFFVLFSGAYVLFRLWREQGFNLLKWAKVLVPAMGVAFLFAAGPLLSGYKLNVENTAQVQTQNPEEKWNYITQWSFPPQEVIQLVAPGYFGWRSGEPEGPYWGRMGRSPGWEESGRGFKNFQLDNPYVGMIPIAFAVFALLGCWKTEHRAEVLFWTFAALTALWLSMGKFSFLYKLFYQLPIVNNIRAPVKFLQVFQVCLAILTAYGFDILFGQRGDDRKSKGESLKPTRRDQRSGTKKFFWMMMGVLGVLGLWALILMLNRADGVAEFVGLGWASEAARVMVQNKITALWHASFMAAVVTVVFALFSFPRFEKLLQFRSLIAAALVLMVAVDAVKLSKHYVKEMPRCYIEANALTDFLQENIGEERVALLTQQGIYNIWLTYLLPYNNVATFNFAQMPRMPVDYKNFLTATSQKPLQMWCFSGVKYLLGPTAVEKQLPANQARKVFAYDLVPAANNGFRVVASPQGAHAVFELLGTVPRYAVVAPVKPVDDQLALKGVANSLRKPIGSIEVLSHRSGRVELKIQSDRPGTLRSATRWDTDWKATVDGESVEVERIDYLCQGVSVPAGTTEVILVYSPTLTFFYMQCAGCFLLLGALLVTQALKHKSKEIV